MDILLTLIISAWYFICIIGLGLFITAYCNTKDGQFFQILNPISIFQPSLFTEEGNKYRKAVMYLYAALIILGVIWWQVSLKA